MSKTLTVLDPKVELQLWKDRPVTALDITRYNDKVKGGRRIKYQPHSKKAQNAFTLYLSNNGLHRDRYWEFHTNPWIQHFNPIKSIVMCTGKVPCIACGK